MSRKIILGLSWIILFTPKFSLASHADVGAGKGKRPMAPTVQALREAVDDVLHGQASDQSLAILLQSRGRSVPVIVNGLRRLPSSFESALSGQLNSLPGETRAAVGEAVIRRLLNPGEPEDRLGPLIRSLGNEKNNSDASLEVLARVWAVAREYEERGFDKILERLLHIDMPDRIRNIAISANQRSGHRASVREARIQSLMGVLTTIGPSPRVEQAIARLRGADIHPMVRQAAVASPLAFREIEP